MILLGTKKEEEGSLGLSAGQLGMILGARLVLLLGAVGLFVAAIFAPSGLGMIFGAAGLLVILGYAWVYFRTRRLLKLASKRSTE
jgi:hypothetical protein